MTASILAEPDLTGGPSPRMGVTLAGWSADGSVDVYRVHPDTSRHLMRGMSAVSGGAAFGWDYEAPFGVPLHYEADDAGATVRSAGAADRTNAILNPRFRDTSGTAEVRRNLCTNPQPTTVTGYAGNAITTDVAPWDATRTAAKSTASGAGTHYMFSANGGAAVTGDVVTVSAMLQCPAGSWYRPTVHVRTGNTYYTAGAVYVLSDGNPVRVTATATLTADAVDVDLAVLFGTSSGGGVSPAGTLTYMGDVIIEKNTPGGPYFDGATAAADGLTFAWTGTANASASTATGEVVTGWTPQAGGTFVKGGGDDAVLRGAASYLVGNDAEPLPGCAAGEYWAARLTVAPVDGETQGGIALAFQIHDGTVYVSDRVTITLTAGGAPQEVTLASTVPLTRAGARLYMYPSTTGVGTSREVARLSRVLMQKVSGPGEIPGPYFDGSTPLDVDHGARWAGTTDAAPSESYPLDVPLDVDQVWVSVPGLPAYAVHVDLVAKPSPSRGRESTALRPMGRARPIVLSDVLSSPDFTVTLRTKTLNDADTLEQTVEAAGTLLLRIPGIRQAWQYVAATGLQEVPYVPYRTPANAPVNHPGNWTDWQLGGPVVDSPVGGVFGDPTASYQVLVDTYTDYSAVLATEADYVDVLKGVVT